MLIHPEVIKWRTEDPVLDEKTRDIKVGGMFPHQRRWWELKNFVRLLVGGYGSGKTFMLCKRMIALALHNCPAPVIIVSPTYKIARRTTIPTMRDLLSGRERLLTKDGAHRFGWHFHQTAHEFRIWYGKKKATVIIASGENPDALKGSNLAGGGIDEPFIQKQGVLDQVMARLRHPRARQIELNLTGTPEQLNWGYDLVEGELADQYDVGFVRAATKENLALDPSYEARLRLAYDDKTVDAYLNGEFVNLAAGLVYHAFNPHVNIVDAEMPKGATLGCGMDFNVNPMAFCVFWHDKKARRMHFFDEFELPNSDTEYACGLLTEKYPNLRNVFPDASGRARHTNAPGGMSDFTYIQDAGLTVWSRRANPARRDRYNSANGAMKSREVDGTPVDPIVTISPKCKALKKNLLGYAFETMMTDEGKAMSHLVDAFSYPICYLYPAIKRRILTEVA